MKNLIKLIVSAIAILSIVAAVGCNKSREHYAKASSDVDAVSSAESGTTATQSGDKDKAESGNKANSSQEETLPTEPEKGDNGNQVVIDVTDTRPGMDKGDGDKVNTSSSKPSSSSNTSSSTSSKGETTSSDSSDPGSDTLNTSTSADTGFSQDWIN